MAVLLRKRCLIIQTISRSGSLIEVLEVERAIRLKEPAIESSALLRRHAPPCLGIASSSSCVARFAAGRSASDL
jgi:hypothetical protein